MDEQQYINERLIDQIKYYSKKSATCQYWYKVLRYVSIVMAVFIPFLTGINSNQNNLYLQFLIGGLGACIAISEGINSINRYHEKWIEYRGYSESLKQQKFMYMTKVGIYNVDDADAFKLLVQNVESILAKETADWTQIMADKKN